jgi:ribonuclease HI
MISIDVDGAVNKTGGSFSLVITCNGRSEVKNFKTDIGKDITPIEMKGINAAMKYFLNKKPNELGVINTDNLLSVKLITGVWTLREDSTNERLKKELRKAVKVYGLIKDRVVLKYINREYNSADQYAKQTLKQLTKEAHKNEG